MTGEDDAGGALPSAKPEAARTAAPAPPKAAATRRREDNDETRRCPQRSSSGRGGVRFEESSHSGGTRQPGSRLRSCPRCARQRSRSTSAAPA